MDKQEFWALVDRTTAHEADPDAQVEALRSELDALSAEQVVAFEQQFDAVLRESYSWDLWGAAYVANGGASDDGFDYFRFWLISKGRAVYEAVLADPDSLADLLAPDSEGDLEFEEFAYVAAEVWAEKTGQEPDEIPFVGEMPESAGPSGEPFSEESEALAARYPRLWEKFGD